MESLVKRTSKFQIKCYLKRIVFTKINIYFKKLIEQNWDILKQLNREHNCL